MVKFTQLESTPPLIRIEGRLNQHSVAELHALTRPPAGTIDLAGLSSVDRTGVVALMRLRAEGWRIIGASLYLESLLEEAQA